MQLPWPTICDNVTRHSITSGHLSTFHIAGLLRLMRFHPSTLKAHCLEFASSNPNNVVSFGDSNLWLNWLYNGMLVCAISNTYNESSQECCIFHQLGEQWTRSSHCINDISDLAQAYVSSHFSKNLGLLLREYQISGKLNYVGKDLKSTLLFHHRYVEVRQHIGLKVNYRWVTNEPFWWMIFTSFHPVLAESVPDHTEAGDSGGLWWPNTLLKHCMVFFTLICHLSVWSQTKTLAITLQHSCKCHVDCYFMMASDQLKSAILLQSGNMVSSKIHWDAGFRREKKSSQYSLCIVCSWISLALFKKKCSNLKRLGETSELNEELWPVQFPRS